MAWGEGGVYNLKKLVINKLRRLKQQTLYQRNVLINERALDTWGHSLVKK